MAQDLNLLNETVRGDGRKTDNRTTLIFWSQKRPRDTIVGRMMNGRAGWRGDVMCVSHFVASVPSQSVGQKREASSRRSLTSLWLKWTRTNREITIKIHLNDKFRQWSPKRLVHSSHRRDWEVSQWMGDKRHGKCLIDHDEGMRRHSLLTEMSSIND